MTLSHYAGNLPAAHRQQGVRQFIETVFSSGDQHRLTVVLDLPSIDTPALRKTVIMLRRWKRLRPGRHEYGPTQHFG